ncbi:hypothetical protein KK062_30630, partial [Fulvivirgaceae bacterium PWU5]
SIVADFINLHEGVLIIKFNSQVSGNTDLYKIKSFQKIVIESNGINPYAYLIVDAGNVKFMTEELYDMLERLLLVQLDVC